jgi:CheY-like chemotaxis protein
MPSTLPAALIVEDQPFIGLVASDILEEAGFQTAYAYDAAEALVILADRPEIHVVVTEANLPGSIDGVELARRVAAERPNARVVLTTAGSEQIPAGLPPSIRALRKPYASAELRALASDMAQLESA